METLRTAVIGAGNMGRHHVRLYQEIKGSELVGVADKDPALLKGIKVPTFADFKEMLKEAKPDVVSVVVPTQLHAKIGCEVLKQANALIEKPIALGREDAQKLVDAAKSAGTKMMVGHIERYNPAVRWMKQHVPRNEFLTFSIMRLGPLIPRSRTTGVILDLGIHDIDTIRFLTDEEPEHVHAYVRHVKITDFEDHAHVFMRMPSCDASLISNWISPRKIRHMYAVTQKSFYYVDYVTQEITAYEREEGYDPWKEGGEARKIALEKKEPLKEELTDWLDAVRKGKPAPITGEDAFESLKVALRATRVAYESDPNE
jgi:predicted dehydrogenase